MIYLLKCERFLKVGYTKSFESRLQAIRAAVPFLVEVLMTRGGTLEEEQEFHQAHKDYLAGYGGREWYVDAPEFRRDAEEFLRLPVADVDLD
jgi:hypothetical protein